MDEQILQDFKHGMTSYDLKEKYNLGNKKIINLLKLHFGEEEYEKIWKQNKNNKIKQSISLGSSCKIFIIDCKCCEKKFVSNRSRIYCSRSCKARDSKSLQKMINIVRQNVENGTHKGWTSREGKNPSYPERFFIKVLNNNKISFEREKPTGKFFIDFAINSKMIALEIDGKQHEELARKESDLRKDKHLTGNGWKVYRIAWKSINNEKGKKYMKNEIDKFISFYNNN